MSIVQVMKFGCRRVVEGKQALDQQSFLAHRYYNAMIELERAKRTKYREIRAKHTPGYNEAELAVAELDEQIDVLRRRIKLKRAHASTVGTKVKATKRVEDSGEKERIANLKTERKRFYEQLKELRATFNGLVTPGREAYKERKGKHPPATQAGVNVEVTAQMMTEDWHAAWKETQTLDAWYVSEHKRLRAASGLTHGAYAAVDDAIAQASKTSTEDPRFRAWDGGRKVGVQLTGDVSMMQIMAGQSTKFRLTDMRQAHPGSNGNRARSQYAIAWLRTGSDEKKAPVWTKIEVKIHRPIPQDARVRWVYLVPRSEGGRTNWTLQLTLELTAPLIERAPGKGAAVVDLRWTKVDGGILVADVSGEPVVMPDRIVSGLELANRLRGAADQHFDEARAALGDWLTAGRPVPQWMTEATEHIGKWRNHSKLAGVAKRWVSEFGDVEPLWNAWKAERLLQTSNRQRRDVSRSNRGTGASGPWLDLYSSWDNTSAWLKEHGASSEPQRFAMWLEWWRRKDAHITEWSSNCRRKNLAHRKDFYRSVAAKLCTRYETIEMDKLDLAATARRKKVEKDEDEIHAAARRQRVYAAPSELKEALVGAFGKNRFVERERDGGADGGGIARKTKMSNKLKLLANVAKVESADTEAE